MTLPADSASFSEHPEGTGSRAPGGVSGGAPGSVPQGTPSSPFVWSAFDRAPAFIAILRGPEHVFEYYNPSYHQLIGFRDVMGMTVREALPDVEGQGYFEFLDRVVANGEPVGGLGATVNFQKTPDAPVETRTLDFVYQPLFGADGVANGVMALGVDVTEREEVRGALNASEDRYRTLFTTIDEGYCLCEIVVDDAGKAADYRFLEVNPAFAGMTGITADAIGRTARDLVPGLEDHWVETYARAGLGREAFRFEQGSEAMGRWFDVYVTPVEAPEARRFALVFTEISERRRAENEIRDLNATLEERVDDRTREVRELAGRLTVAEQAERQRIAQVLHDDLQQQLYGLSVTLALAKAKQGTPDAERYVTRAAEITEGAMKLTRSLVTSLSPVVLQSESVAAILEWMAGDVQARYGLDVETDGDVTVPSQATRIVLYQTLHEALFNVVKHAGVMRARVRVWPEGNEVVAEVVDEGAGFDTAEARPEGATGLGLFSVRERLEAVGGRLEVSSEVGAGTHVTVRLPLEA